MDQLVPLRALVDELCSSSHGVDAPEVGGGVEGGIWRGREGDVLHGGRIEGGAVVDFGGGRGLQGVAAETGATGGQAVGVYALAFAIEQAHCSNWSGHAAAE